MHSRLFTLWGRVRTGSEVVPSEVSSSFGLRLILLQMLDAGEFLNTCHKAVENLAKSMEYNIMTV